jgi:hypothetical protein
MSVVCCHVASDILNVHREDCRPSVRKGGLIVSGRSVRDYELVDAVLLHFSSELFLSIFELHVLF